MAKNKTQQTENSVDEFLDSLDDPQTRDDCRQLVEIMQRATRAKPKMWGGGIVGFGQGHYKYASGREGDWFLTGFSPRKGNLSLYVVSGFEPWGDLLAKLGKHKTAKSCLYVKRLSDVNLPVLRQLIEGSVADMRRRQAKPG